MSIKSLGETLAKVADSLADENGLGKAALAEMLKEVDVCRQANKALDDRLDLLARSISTHLNERADAIAKIVDGEHEIVQPDIARAA